MTDQELLKLAESEGFLAAITTPELIPVNPDLRKYCEENLCGRYNANYSCPPDCGTVQELHKKLLAHHKALVLQTIWNINGYEDITTITNAKSVHNTATLRLIKKMQEHGYRKFCAAHNGCSLCTPCKKTENQPCPYPELRINCLSSYCIDVAKLEDQCRLSFQWSEKKLYLFGMIAFHEEQTLRL